MDDAGDPRRALRTALGLNAVMFVVELAGGILFDSSGLLADSLDMLADAAAYGIALAAAGRAASFRTRAARANGILLLILGAGVLLDVVRRTVSGSEPVGALIIGVAVLALIVNAFVLRLLARYRKGEVHLRAAWIFTRADVLANLGIILGGLLVLITGSPAPDLVLGAGVGLYVMKEAREILREARDAARSEAER